VIGLVGPNGAARPPRCAASRGSSPTSGRIAVDGFDLGAQPVRAKSRLRTSPTTPPLRRPHGLGASRLHRVGVPGHDWKARAEALLERFQLTPKRRPSPASSPAACARRSHLLRLPARPAFVMLDEPLPASTRGHPRDEGLDPRAGGHGLGVPDLDHLLALVEDLCSKLLIVLEGRQVFYGRRGGPRPLRGSDARASLEDVFFRATSRGCRSSRRRPSSRTRVCRVMHPALLKLLRLRITRGRGGSDRGSMVRRIVGASSPRTSW